MSKVRITQNYYTKEFYINFEVEDLRDNFVHLTKEELEKVRDQITILLNETPMTKHLEQV